MGRHPDCDIVLDAGAVSRQHAKILAKDGTYQLEDMGSRNGTFLNGRLIHQAAALQDGDLIRICDLELSFHHEPSSSELRTLGLKGDLQHGSSVSFMMVDDPEESASRAVTGKLDMRGSSYGTQLIANADSKLTALIEIMKKSLGRTVSLDEVLPKVLEGLFKVFLQADRGFIILRERDGSLQPRWIKTRRDEADGTVRISRTILREIMEKREAIISLDASNDERFEMSQSITDFRIRSMIAAPLLDSEGEPIGAIQIDTQQQRNRFEDKDLEVLGAIAVQAGMAIENAQLHEQVLQQKLVEQDLLLAKQVQAAFLPAVAMDLGGYDFFQYYQAANHIGGDYFDYIRLSGDRVAIVVADVVGHGVAAAMFMAKLSAETRFALAREDDPATAVALLNQNLTSLGIGRMVTMLVIELDFVADRATIVNAGHMPPLLRRSHGELLEPSDRQAGFPLGIFDDLTYEATKVDLEPGDLMVLYTDGIFEAPNIAGQQFSINRMRQLVTQGNGQVESTGQSIVDQVQAHIAETAQEDDMCLVIVGRCERREERSEGIGRTKGPYPA
jgi:serine phosphatase RsbU (regulator of sigma subunit)